MKLITLAKTKEYIVGVTMIVLMTLVMTSAFPQLATADTSFIAEAVEGITENVEQPEFPVVKDVEPAYEMWVLATAYTSEVAQTDSTPCIPAMGSFNLCEHYETYEVADTIAANFLGLGRLVEFETEGIEQWVGDHKYTVRDRMNSKYNGQNRIDIWMPDKSEAIKFGARWIKMKVYPYKDMKR